MKKIKLKKAILLVIIWMNSAMAQVERSVVCEEGGSKLSIEFDAIGEMSMTLKGVDFLQSAHRQLGIPLNESHKSLTLTTVYDDRYCKTRVEDTIQDIDCFINRYAFLEFNRGSESAVAIGSVTVQETTSRLYLGPSLRPTQAKGLSFLLGLDLVGTQQRALFFQRDFSKASCMTLPIKERTIAYGEDAKNISQALYAILEAEAIRGSHRVFDPDTGQSFATYCRPDDVCNLSAGRLSLYDPPSLGDNYFSIIGSIVIHPGHRFSLLDTRVSVESAPQVIDKSKVLFRTLVKLGIKPAPDRPYDGDIVIRHISCSGFDDQCTIIL